MVVPGEEITKEIIALIKGYEQAGLTVLGFEEMPESRESDQGKESREHGKIILCYGKECIR